MPQGRLFFTKSKREPRGGLGDDSRKHCSVSKLLLFDPITAERNRAEIKISGGTERGARNTERETGNPAGQRCVKALAGGNDENNSVSAHPAADAFRKMCLSENKQKNKKRHTVFV